MRHGKALYFLIISFWVFNSCSYFQKGNELDELVKKEIIPLTGEKEGLAYAQTNSIYYFLVGEYLSNLEQNHIAIKSFEKVSSLDPQSASLNLVLAKEYLKQGLVFEATSALGRSLALDSESREALLLMANLHITSKNYAEARVILEKLLEKDSEDEEALVTWVQFEIENNNNDIAYRLLNEFLKKKKDSALAYFYLGRLEQINSQYKKAIAHFKKAMDLRSGFVQAAAYLGILQEAVGDEEGSLKTFAYLAEQTDNAAFHRRVGQIYLDRKDSKKALAAFRDYERLDSGDLNNKVKIALLYIDLKEYPKAEQKLREIVTLSPESENIRFYLAVVLEQQKKFEEALQEYKQLGPESKLYPDAVRGMIFTLKQLHKEDVAWEAYLQKLNAASEMPEHREDLYEIGVNFLVSEKDHQKAMEFIDKALAEYPKSVAIRFSKGTLLEKSGDWKASIKVMEAIIKENPNESSALNFVGYLYADKDMELNKAEEYVRRALKERPNDPYILDSLGWVLFRKGKFEEAEQQLKYALTLKPDESIIANHIGDVLVKQGKLEEAIAYYEKALELGPDTKEEKMALQRKMSNIRTPNKQAHKECERHHSDSCNYILYDSREPAQAK